MKSWFLVLLAVLGAGGAEAAPEESEARQGEVRVLIFQSNGRPKRGAQVQAQGGLSKRSDQDGAARLMLSPGSHILEVKVDGASTIIQDVPVLRGEQTEVVVLLNDPPIIDIEAPEREALPASSTETSTAGQGVILGVVFDADKKPVQGARIFARGLGAEARSDARGRFSLQASSGGVELTVIHPDYTTRTVPNVVVPKDGEAQVQVELLPSALELQTFVVVMPKIEGGAVFVLEERKNSSEVSDVLGADQISKSGDSDAASALKRVTGVTVVGGRFVYVRGLGERYSSTLLNGSTLPSPDPERRVVPLDLFPSSIIGSILVQKTFSPDLPGEFGGGTVVLRTKEVPKRPQASVGFSAGLLLGTSFTDSLSGGSSATDWLGVGARARALPSDVRAASDAAPLRERDAFGLTPGYSAEELERFGESLELNFGVGRQTIRPNLGMNGSVGTSFEVLGKRLGFLLGMTYGNSWTALESQRNDYNLSGGELATTNDYDFVVARNSINLAAVATVELELSKQHLIRSTFSLSRLSENTAREYEGFNDDVKTTIRVNMLRWLEQMLITEQIAGEHVLNKATNLRLDWRYMISVADRAEPNRRDIRYDLEPQTGEYLFSTRPDGNRRLYSQLDDLNHDLGMDVSMPMKLFGQVETKFKAGVQGVFKDRQVDTRRYIFDASAGGSQIMAVRRLSPDRIFTAETIGPGGFKLSEFTQPTDNYEAGQQLYAGYVSADLGIFESLRLAGGVRVEVSRQQVETFQPFSATEERVRAQLNTIDVLPALTASWGFWENMVLRAGFSRTVSRPAFRELAPASFRDVVGSRAIQGNPELNRGSLTNVDLRWEWYPSPGESFSVAAFYKNFQDPIEVNLIGGSGLTSTFVNVPSANNFGAEFEARKELGFIWEPLRDAYVAANLTLVQSTVNVGSDGVQTSTERPLQGQSPFAVNAQLGYDNADSGTSFSLLYNVFGRRISEVGAEGLPDIYEEPVHRMDLVASQRIERFKLSFRASNLLDLPIRRTQLDREVLRFKRGRAFSVSVSSNF